MGTLFDSDTWLVRLVLEKSLAGIYLIAFAIALNQFPALLGEQGLLPVPDFLQRVNFWDAPSIFHGYYSDRFLKGIAWGGIFISFLILLGVTHRRPAWLPMVAWFINWAFYLSIVNVGQTFYAFGWESMLLEAGFFAIFLGPSWIKPSFIPILILRWMLFRLEMGAGLIKLRGDPSWRDLTALYYHYETQPMPNPLSWYFNLFPAFAHRFGVLFSHFVQVVVPAGVFFPQPFAMIAGCLIIFHQFLLIVSGNYSWLNWLTVIVAFSTFSDVYISPSGLKTPTLIDRPFWYDSALYLLFLGTLLLSIQPALNLVSRHQLMNYSFNRFHLVNAYGAFGSMTKKRYEIVIEGTKDTAITEKTEWHEYHFKGKPGDLSQRPPQFAPYHLRLDWLMWFLPFSVQLTPTEIYLSGYERWFIQFVKKLLLADKKVLGLLKRDPFENRPPHFIRARFYLYQFTGYQEYKSGKKWWKRKLIGEYLPPVSLKQIPL